MIIGISGKRGVGKTTAAEQIVKYFGGIKKPFAGRLRELAKEMFPFNDKDLSDPTKKEAPFGEHEWSPRDFMLNLGMFLRYHDQDYFLKRVLNAPECAVVGNIIVIDDLRFKNELEMLKARGGKTIRINRFAKLNPYHTKLLDQDPSETDLDDAEFDYTIESCKNTSMIDLSQQIFIIMKALGYKPTHV